MPNNLTLNSAGFNASGKFGSSLNAGYGMQAASSALALPLTLELWVKGGASGSINVAFGATSAFWIGSNGGNAEARYGNGDPVNIPTSKPIRDGAWHHLALVVTATGSTFYVDGVNSGTSAAASPGSIVYPVAIGAFGSGGFAWGGDVDEVAIWSTAKYSSNFTPPTAPYGGSETGLVSVYHLNGDGLDGQGASSDTTVPVMTGSLTSSAITSGGFTLTWPAATDNVAVTGYEYSTDAGTTYTDAGNVLTKAITGLAASTAYATRVRAYDAAGNKATPLSLSVTTSASADSTAPTQSGSITSSAITTSGFTISWPAGADNVAVTGYEYSIDGGSSYIDAGNVLTKAVTGLASATGYAVRVRAYDAAGNRSTPALAATVTTASTTNNALTGGTSNVLFSPYTWNITANDAKTINAGAYFKTIFSGTACTLQFDVSANGAPMTQISYRVDGYGAWVTTPLASSVVITVPSDTSGYASAGGHLLEVIVKSTSEGLNRWTPQATAAYLTGIILDASATLTKPPALPLNCLFYGDSITEGVRTVNGGATNDTDRNDGAQSWAFQAARILGAEIGQVGFGYHGFIHAGSGGVPAFPSSYNLLYSGVSRSFSPAPDFIAIMEGTNDGSDVTTPATTVLNGLLAATPATTKIIVLRPFNGTSRAAELQAAIAACTAPARCAYIDTAGFFTSSNSSDGLHPYGNENLFHIAPAVANAIRPYVQPLRGTRTARTVTLTLNDRSGNPRANLSGLKWAFFDQATAGALGVNADGGTGATTNSSGVLSLTVYTTLASGATGWLVLSDSAGNAATVSNAFSGPVTVA